MGIRLKVLFVLVLSLEIYGCLGSSSGGNPIETEFQRLCKEKATDNTSNNKLLDALSAKSLTTTTSVTTRTTSRHRISLSLIHI